VGISTESQDVIVPGAICQMKDTVAGVRMIDNDPVSTSLLLANRPREVVPGMDGFVIMEGRNLPPGKTADNNGVFVPTPRIGVGYGGSRGESYAFNYASTESYPEVHNSQSDEHNPYHASIVFVNLENNNGGGYRRTLLQDTNTTGSSDKQQQQQNCLVVQGNMIITTATSSTTTTNSTFYSKYENLEGRILDALARDVNAMKLGLPTNDVIVRLHMASPYGFGAGSGLPTSTLVAANNMESSNNLNPLTASFWQQEYANIPYAMSILVGMTVLSLTLLALFVKTSRRGHCSKSKKIDNGKTITNWGVELDANRVLKDLHKANKEVDEGGDEENIPLSHSQSQKGMKDKLDNSKIAIVSGVGGVATNGRIGRSSRERTSSVKEKIDKSKVAAATTTAVVAVASGVGVVAERIGRSLSPKRRTWNEKEEVELDAANRILKNLSKSNKKSEDGDLTTAAAAAAATTGMIGRLVSITKKDTPPKSKRAMSHDDTNSSESVASISIMIDSPKRTSMSTLGRRERSLVQDRSVHILDDVRWAKEKLPHDEELPKPTGEKGLVVAAAMTATAASVAAASAWKKTKTKVQAVSELTNTQETSKPLFRDGIPRIVSPVRDAISRAVSPLSGATTSADGENVEHQLRDYDSIVACDIVPVCVGPFLQRYAATEDEIETSWMPLARGIWGTDTTNKPPAAVRLTSTNGNENRGDRVRRNISNAVAAIDSRSKSPSRSRSSKMDPPMAPIKMDPPGGLIGKIRTRTTGKSSMEGRNTLPKVVSKERLELSTEEDNSVVEFVEVDGFWSANGLTNYFR
jgi:hypothetical protein